jgi:uncharacterized protein YjiS (DUF1127 family)
MTANTRPLMSRSGIGTRLICRLFDNALVWHARSRHRRILSELDDRMLRDVGLTRVDIHREVAKPFWRS